MKLLITIFVNTILLLCFSGCLLFHKISYDVKLTENGKGTATVTFTDIRSDAANDREFEADTTALFNYILQSDEFLTEIKKEGKQVVLRELNVNGDTLIGKSIFNFDNISAVEGIVYEDGFFYLTLPLEDSVITTNGEIIHSKQYKRILWDGKLQNLNFEIYSTDFAEGRNRKLTEFVLQK